MALLAGIWDSSEHSESRKGWQSPRRCPVFAGAFVNARDNLLITTFTFICKTGLEDNLIIYYKRLLYLLSLSPLIKAFGRDGHREPSWKRENCAKFQPAPCFDGGLKVGVIKVIERSSLIFPARCCLVLSH